MATSTSESANTSKRRVVVELFALSFLALYLELFAIRWMSCELQAFRVFKTFPLVTAFVGLGVGLGLGKDKAFRLAPWALLLFAGLVKLPVLMGIDWVTLPTASVFVNWENANQYGAQLAQYLVFFSGYLLLVLMGEFAPFVAIGARLGVLLNQFQPLKAYSVNLAGSIAGSLAFSVFAFQGWSPWMLLVPAIMVLVYAQEQSRLPRLAYLPMVVAALIIAWQSPLPPGTITYWSPYQRIDVIPVRLNAKQNGQDRIFETGIEIQANKLPFQSALDWVSFAAKPDTPPSVLEFLRQYSRRYILPYLLNPFKDVLVVGAGSGSDVAEGLRQGAQRIDAVDIDPAIIDAGRKFNPRHPYQDSRVTIVCNDARDFFNRCNKKYDLIIFGFLDSHVVSAQGASARLDNYVYTRESFAKAASLLKDDGLMVVSYFTAKEWFTDRLFATLKDAVGYTPGVITDSRSKWLDTITVFLAGNPVKKKQVQLPADQKDIYTLSYDFQPRNARVLTDDWPYLYVVPVGIDWPYLVIVGDVLLISVFAARRLLFAKQTQTPQNWQLFFMGAAFMLMELQSISRLALLYGANWLTTAIVINCILVLAFIANLIVDKAKIQLQSRQKLLYVGLITTLVASWALPIDSALSWGVQFGFLGFFIVTLLTVLPMFFAGLIFSTAYSSVASPATALSFNLLGAVIGALLEYLSYYGGINSLLLVALALYLISLVCAVRVKTASA